MVNALVSFLLLACSCTVDRHRTGGSRFWKDLEILLDKAGCQCFPISMYLETCYTQDLLLPGAVILAACQDIEEHEFWGVLTNGRQHMA